MPRVGNVARGRDIVGLIREDEPRRSAIHKRPQDRRVGCIATDEAMFAEEEDVAKARHGGDSVGGRQWTQFDHLHVLVESDDIDLRRRESADLDG